MKKYAIIVAGGSGVRMGTSTPKQYLELRGKPLLWYTLNTFLNAYDDLHIILVVAEDYFGLAKNIYSSINDARVKLAKAGINRFYSVGNGLSQVPGNAIVFVHDAVRCLVTEQLIHRCYDATLQNGNAIPCVTAVDSIRIQTATGNEAINRKNVMLIQTPQTFYSDDLKSAYKQEFDEAFTDEATVLEGMGKKIHLIAGEVTNIKITNPIDMVVADKILAGFNN